VAKLASALEFIPSGPGGFDRSLERVYLISGSVSTPFSPFLALFQDRITGLGELSDVGSFGQVVCLLREVWSHVDGQAALGGSEAQHVS
jgi:C6 transcription factor Pro1